MRLSSFDTTSLILAFTLVASVVAHAGVHYELGELAKAQALAALALAEAQERAARHAVLEFDLSEDPRPTPPAPAATPPVPEPSPADQVESDEEPPAETDDDRAARLRRRARERATRLEREREAERERAIAEREPPPAPPEPPPTPPALAITPPPTPPPPPALPPPPEQPRIAVRQHSANPDDPPPETSYIAEENNTVEEETVAEITNLDRDDVETSVGAAQRPSEPTERRGNADDALLAESEDVDGSDDRRPTPEEVTRRPRERPPTPPRAEGRARTEAPADSRAERAAGEDGRAGSRARREEAQRGRAGGGDPLAGGSPAVLASAQGSWAVRREGALGAGGGDGAGGVRVPERAGREGADDGNPRGSAQAGRRPGPGRGRPGIELTLRYSQLVDVVGEERLAEERQAYVQEQRSRIHGASSGQRWEQFRAALENYMPSVRPGEQTALNAARSPFATYIARMHDRLHYTYHNFVENLPLDPSGPFGDQSLRTMLEIVLNRDGTVHRVGVVRSSGLSMFDYGAYNAVMRGQPYPVAPEDILSGDGRVYMHWGFHREQPYCHQSHARPYLLPNIGGGHDDAPVTQLQDSVVVPSGATADFGISAGAGGADDEADEAEDDEAEDDDPDEGADEAPRAPGSASGPTRAEAPRSRGPRL